MKNISQILQMALLSIVLNVIVGLHPGYAQIPWEIRVSPDIQKPIRLESKLKPLQLEIVIPRSSNVAVQSAGELNPRWELDGSGKLSNTRGAVILYSLPEEIPEELALQNKPEEVTIRVTIHNTSGKPIETKSIQFEILASVRQLGKIAQKYFDNRCFMDTAGKTVQCKGTTIDVCKKILEIEVDNSKALSLLREMKKFYKQWGDDAWRKKDKANVKKQYDNYLAVANYLPATEIEAEKQDVENKLADLKIMERERELRTWLEKYRGLKKQNGKNDDILGVIIAIERAFGENSIASFHTTVDGMLKMDRQKMGSSLQSFNSRLTQAYEELHTEKTQRKAIIQTLGIIATLRELQRVYEHFPPKDENLDRLNDTIQHYEDSFLQSKSK